MKALNATGQQNINFDTLFQVFLLNSVQHVDFHFRFFQSRSVVTLSVIQKPCKEGMVERMCAARPPLEYLRLISILYVRMFLNSTHSHFIIVCRFKLKGSEKNPITIISAILLFKHNYKYYRGQLQWYSRMKFIT